MYSTFFGVKHIWNIFLEKYQCWRKSRNESYIRGWGDVICVIMTNCVRKSICDSINLSHEKHVIVKNFDSEKDKLLLYLLQVFP